MVYLKGLLRLATIFALVTIGAFFLRLRTLVTDLDHTVVSGGQLVSETEYKLYGKGGLSDMVGKTMLHVDKITGETATLIQKEHKSASEANNKLLAVLGHADTVVGTLNTTLKGVGDDLHNVTEDLHPVLVALAVDVEDVDPLLKETKRAIADIDANLINDPDIKATLKQLSQVMTNTNEILVNGGRISKDAADKFHHLTTDPPTLKSKILTVISIAYRIALLKATIGK